MASMTDQLEPSVAATARLDGFGEGTVVPSTLMHTYAALSTAVSLKRIADALVHDPAATALNIRDLLSNIEMNTRNN